MSRGPGKWTVLAVLFVVLVLADQYTKFLAVDRLTDVFERHGQTSFPEKVRAFYGEHRQLELQATRPHVVWAPMWRHIYVENPGAAWGLGRNLSEDARNSFFRIISVAAVVIVLLYFRKLRDEQRTYQVALSMLMAGAVGNFIDRIARRYVIDFIDWYAGGWHWPTFNVADSLIVMGVALLLVHPGQKKRAAGAPELEVARRRRA